MECYKAIAVFILIRRLEKITRVLTKCPVAKLFVQLKPNFKSKLSIF